MAARECSAEGGSHAMALAAAVGEIGWLGFAIVWRRLGRVFGWGLGMGVPWGVWKINKAITS